MAEFDIDEVLLEASYKNKKGYIDIRSSDDIKSLENIMYEMKYPTYFIESYVENLQLNEVNIKDENYIALRSIIREVITDVRAKSKIIRRVRELSPDEVKSIIDFRKKDGNKMSDFVTFINAHRNIEKALFYKGPYSNENVGRGETSALICLKNSEKGGGEADLLIHDARFWEVKEAVRKSTFRSGGKYKTYTTKLIKFLWDLNEWMADPKYENTLNNLFNRTEQFNNTNVVDIWKSMAYQDKNTGEITFSEIGVAKFNSITDFIVQFNDAVNELNKQELSDDEKEEVLQIRGINRLFKTTPGTKNKLNKTKIGSKVDLSLEPEMSDTDERFVDYFGVLKKNPMLKGENKNKDLSERISKQIKLEFINKYNGGLLFIHGKIKNDPNAIYYAFTKNDFLKRFSFAGITQGNVPKFKFDE